MSFSLFGEEGEAAGLFVANGIDCIQVIDDDTIQLNLQNSFSTALYSSASLAGPFSITTGIFLTNGGFTMNCGNQDPQSTITWFYFYDNFDASYSDTLSNIVLDVDPMNGGGIANLSWNHPFTSSYSIAPSAYYSINREYPVGVWEEIKQVPTTINSFLDTISICDAFLNYRIDLITGSTCNFVSNVAGDQFMNNTPPSIPEIIQVSVDTAQGFASLTWNAPPQNDVQGYVIVQNVNGFSVAIDTIWDPAITSYVDVNTQVDLNSYAYGIAAFDTCINPNSNPSFFYISPPTALNDFQHTILLENDYFGCDQYSELSWNSYTNWPDGVWKYQLFVSQDGGAYQLLADLGANETTYTHEGLISFSTYCYLVKAINTSQTRFSLSNILCQETVYPGLPEDFYLASAQVDSAENVRLELYVNSVFDIEIEGFSIEALYPNSFDYVEIDYIPYAGGNLIYYTDEDAPADLSSIYYRVNIIDGCGNSDAYSNELNTLYLSAISDEENAINTIVWDQAVGRAGIINGYDLYRIHNDEDPLLIYSAGPSEFYYQDDLSGAYEDDGDYCYFIQNSEISNPYGEFNPSQSNEECTLIDPLVWIPNSFIIDGDTPAFTPVFSYAALDDYTMSIINRWGKVIYETNDAYGGWNGYYKGNPVEQGVYIYVIELKDGFGKLISQAGTVTVFSNR
jgi:gliding motility-associated-like protein